MMLYRYPTVIPWGRTKVETQLGEVLWGDSLSVSLKQKFESISECWDAGWMDSLIAWNDITVVCGSPADFTFLSPWKKEKSRNLTHILPATFKNKKYNAPAFWFWTKNCFNSRIRFRAVPVSFSKFYQILTEILKKIEQNLIEMWELCKKVFAVMEEKLTKAVDLIEK